MNNKALLFSLVGLIVVAGIVGIIYPKAVPQVVRERLGSAAGPDQFFPYWSYNNVTRLFDHQDFRQATGTICAFISPSATSTLKSFIVEYTEATGTDLQLHIVKTSGEEVYATSSGFAIGTPFEIKEKGGADANFIVASSTEGSQDVIFPPKRILVAEFGRFDNWDDAGTSGAVGYENDLTGACSVEWETVGYK